MVWDPDEVFLAQQQAQIQMAQLQLAHLQQQTQQLHQFQPQPGPMPTATLPPEPLAALIGQIPSLAALTATPGAIPTAPLQAPPFLGFPDPTTCLQTTQIQVPQSSIGKGGQKGGASSSQGVQRRIKSSKPGSSKSGKGSSGPKDASSLNAADMSFKGLLAKACQQQHNREVSFIYSAEPNEAKDGWHASVWCEVFSVAYPSSKATPDFTWRVEQNIERLWVAAVSCETFRSTYYSRGAFMSKKLAENAAAHEALKAEFPDFDVNAPIVSPTAAQPGQPPPEIKAPTWDQICERRSEKRKAAMHLLDHKSRINVAMTAVAGRPLVKDELVYNTQSDANMTISTLKISCLDTPHVFSGVMQPGTTKEARRLAESSAAEAAFLALEHLILAKEVEQQIRKDATKAAKMERQKNKREVLGLLASD